MRGGILLVALPLGACSLNVDGLQPEEVPLVDSSVAIDSGTTSIDTTVTTSPEDSAVVDSTTIDTFVTDTSIAPIDTAMPMDTTVADTADSGGCIALPILTPCANIPHYEKLASGQTMDGRADDFCDVPFLVFDNSTGAVKDPSPTPPEAKTTMTVRAAWSSYGLHLHFAVKDPKILVATPSTEKNLWMGDSVEVYTAGYEALTGPYDGMTKDLGAQQLIVAPPTPDGTIPTRAVYFFSGTSRGSPPSDRYAGRVTADGYEVEYRLPWADLKPVSVPAPGAGKRIAFTFGFNNKYDPMKNQAFSVYQVKTVTTPVSGCTQPFCDDRYWCTPQLDP